MSADSAISRHPGDVRTADDGEHNHDRANSMIWKLDLFAVVGEVKDLVDARPVV